VWWLVPVLSLALVELYAFSRHSTEDYPTLSLLADRCSPTTCRGGVLLRLADGVLGADRADERPGRIVIIDHLFVAGRDRVRWWWAGCPGGRTPASELRRPHGFVMQYQVGKVPVGRVAVLGFWWWVGWHFFAR
jgi:hypothetical protein